MKSKVLAVVVLGLLVTSIASAHVVVRPASVSLGAFQTFTIGVPSEKPVATIGLKLLIPEGLQYVSPNVKPGWKVTVVKSVTDPNIVTEIDWTGGNIPGGQRDDFFFSAKVPGTETSVVWKAYQTYADGSVVAWEKTSAEMASSTDFSKFGPSSMTKVAADAVPVPQGRDTLTLVVAVLGFVLGAMALREVRKLSRSTNV